MPAVYRQPLASHDVPGKRPDLKRRVTSQSPPRLCRVCGQEAAGIYFSALVCLPCKSFFLRCANGKEPNVKCEKKNCKINAATRTICKFCRYKRCLAIGMTRKELPERADAVNGQELCRVCGDVANGVHFGAVTCEGCKNFFRRSLTEETVVCKKGGNCVVNLKTRKGCRGCRYRKCIAAGMSKEAKKPGRRNRPAEIFTNNVNNMSADLPEVNKNDVITDEIFPSYHTEPLEDMELGQDFMGHSYDPFTSLNRNNHLDLANEYRVELCPDNPSVNTNIDTFTLIDDIVNANYITDQVVSPVQNAVNESIWHSNNAIFMNAQSESFITLEPVPSMPDGATVESPSTPEGTYNEDFSSTSTLSSPSWSPTPSSEGNLTPFSPRYLSNIVITSLDGECPVQSADGYDISVPAIEMEANSNDLSNSRFEYHSNHITDLDNSMLDETLNDVMELLTEDIDFTRIANGRTSGSSCDPEVLDLSGVMVTESDTDAYHLQTSFHSLFSDSKS